jgi:hypothetical protein
VANTTAVAGSRPIDEWLPPGMNTLVGKFWVLSLALVLIGFAWPRRRPTAREVFLVLAFLPLAGGSVRMVAWWLLVIAPVLAGRLAAGLAERQRDAEPERPGLIPAVFFGLIVLGVVFSIPGLDRYNPLLGPARRAVRQTEQDLDRVAACLAERGPGRRIFSRFEWGAYLTCKLGAGYPVFMDGRIDIFPDDVWAEYASVTAGRADWEEILNRYRVDYLLLDARYHERTGLLAAVERSSLWRPTFVAGDARLFVRQKGQAIAKAE